MTTPSLVRAPEASRLHVLSLPCGKGSQRRNSARRIWRGRDRGAFGSTDLDDRRLSCSSMPNATGGAKENRKRPENSGARQMVLDDCLNAIRGMRRDFRLPEPTFGLKD